MSKEMEYFGKAGRKTFLTPSLLVLLILNFLFRFITFGYFIVAFVLKYHEKLLSSATLPVLNQLSVMALPLGTTVDYLTFSLASFLFIQSVTGIIGIMGITCKKKILLVSFAGINVALVMIDVVYLALFASILKNIPGTEAAFRTLYDRISVGGTKDEEWINTFRDLDCNAVHYDDTTILPSGAVGAGCYDRFKGLLGNYVESYIVMIVFNIIVNIACVVTAELSYRTINRNPVLPTKDIAARRITHGILGDVNRLIANHWKSDKVIFISTFLIILSSLVNTSFWIVLMIFFVGQYRDSSLWDVLHRSEDRGIHIGRMATGWTVAVLAIIPLEEFLKVLYFLGVYWQHLKILGPFIGIQLFLVVTDILALILMSFLVEIYMCCYNTVDPHSQCVANGEICRYLASLIRFVWIFVGFTIARVIIHTVGVGFGDRIFKRIYKNNMNKNITREKEQEDKSGHQRTTRQSLLPGQIIEDHGDQHTTRQSLLLDQRNEDHAGCILYSLTAFWKFMKRGNMAEISRNMNYIFTFGIITLLVLDLVYLIVDILLTFEPGFVNYGLQKYFQNITSFSGNVYTIYESLATTYIVIVVFHLIFLMYGILSWRGKWKQSLIIFTVGCVLYSFLGFILLGFSCYFIALENCCIKSDCAFHPRNSIEQMCSNSRVLLEGVVWSNFVFTLSQLFFNGLLGVVSVRVLTNKRVEPEANGSTNSQRNGGHESKDSELMKFAVENPRQSQERNVGQSSTSRQQSQGRIVGQSLTSIPSIGPTEKDPYNFDPNLITDPLNVIFRGREKKKRKKRQKISNLRD